VLFGKRYKDLFFTLMNVFSKYRFSVTSPKENAAFLNLAVETILFIFSCDRINDYVIQASIIYLAL